MLADHNECKHFWMLDHKKYFNPKNKLLDKKTSARIVPVKCHMCKDPEQFTEEEWLERLGDLK